MSAVVTGGAPMRPLTLSTRELVALSLRLHP